MNTPIKYTQLARGEQLLGVFDGDPSDWEGPETSRRRRWESPDGRRGIKFHIWGGTEYGGMWARDIILSIRGDWCSAESIRVQEIRRPDQPTHFNIYLLVVGTKSNDIFNTGASYHSDKEGKLHPPGGGGMSIYQEPGDPLPREEFLAQCRADLVREGIYEREKLPGEIDVEATVIAFANQIVNMMRDHTDFGQPRLIPKPPAIPGTANK